MTLTSCAGLIEQARRENVNKARITAALARITGRIEDGDHAVMETLAHGIGIMTEIITSNLKRTLQEVRIETKVVAYTRVCIPNYVSAQNTGIPFGVVGACKWMFEEKTIVALEQKRLSEELQMEAREATESDEVGEALLTVAMDAGAQDVRVNSETGDVELVCAPDEAAQVRATVADTLGLPVTDMYMAWVPRERVECASEQVRAEVEDFVQQVGENPDVVRVFHNANWKTN